LEGTGSKGLEEMVIVGIDAIGIEPLLHGDRIDADAIVDAVELLLPQPAGATFR
jgi:hypothetical protein